MHLIYNLCILSMFFLVDSKKRSTFDELFIEINPKKL
jgi:hypothetical protein